MPGGIEYYLPLFFDATATLRRLSSAGCHGVPARSDRSDDRARSGSDTEARYRLLRGDPARPLLPPPELFLPADEFHRVLKPFARIELPARGPVPSRTCPDLSKGEGPTQPLPPIQIDRRAGDPLSCAQALRDEHA